MKPSEKRRQSKHRSLTRPELQPRFVHLWHHVDFLPVSASGLSDATDMCKLLH